MPICWEIVHRLTFITRGGGGDPLVVVKNQGAARIHFLSFFSLENASCCRCLVLLVSSGLDVGQVVVELAQVVVVPFIVQNWKNAAAGQLRQILDGDKISFRDSFVDDEVFLYE